MSQSYTAVSRQCFRAFAPAAAALVMTIGGIAAASADLPEHLNLAHPAPAAAPAVPPAPPEPAFVFESPVPGHDIGSPFGLRRLPWEPAGRMHAGVDIAAPSGVAVVATCDGTIVRTGTSASYGRFVEVAHKDGITSFYAHLGRAAKGLQSGMPVAAGDTVGYVGNTGHSTGAHLHFELRKDGRALNPAMFLGRTFATLADLPIKAAGLVSRTVRVAQVSGGTGWTKAARVTRVASKGRGKGRVRATLAAAD